MEKPIMVYYQTNRNTNTNIPASSKYKISRIAAYNNAFSPQINYGTIGEWYLEQINIQNTEIVKRKNFQYKLPTISAISNAINSFFSNLDESYLKNARLEVGQAEGAQVIQVIKDETALLLDQLSAGEKMAIAMVLDIAYRMSIANHQLKNPLETEGIVLIDELELHLHPKWQSSILNAFSKTFPNIQFIVTTHSPLVINHLTNDQIFVLYDFKIIPGTSLHNTYGRDVNSILEDFMGGSERPVAIKKAIEEIENLLDEEQVDTKLARKKLVELRQVIDPNDYELIKLDTLITMGK